MNNPLLKREIGVWGLSFNLMNIMIGAGIFVMPAIVAEGLGAASFIAYLFCGFLISLVMLCFAEIGSIITADGGVYAYIDRTLGNYFGFNAAILYLISAISADAAIANAIVDIADSLVAVEFTVLMRTISFFIIFSSLAFINIRGVKEGVTLVKIITLVKLTPLILFVFLVSPEIQLEFLKIESMPSLHEIGQVSLILFFAFQGSEGGLSVNGEVKNPQKTIPRAIFIAISGALILYLLIQVVSTGVMGPSLALNKENPLGEVANIVLGPIGLTLMIVGAAVSMLGNLSSEILSVPRLLYGAAKDRVIPIKIISAIHPRFATPYVSIIIIAGLDFLFASIGGFKQLAILSSSTVLLVYFGMAVAVIKLRVQKKPRVLGSFRIPGAYLVPIASGAVIIWFMSHLSQKEFIALVIIVAVLALIYFTIVKKINKSKSKTDV
jgi:APA family basic amino acid/polyamine antiporter